MKRYRVVVTGPGVVACNGVGEDDFWRANVAGRSGIGLIDAFETQNFPSRVGAQVRSVQDIVDYLNVWLAKQATDWKPGGSAA